MIETLNLSNPVKSFVSKFDINWTDLCHQEINQGEYNSREDTIFVQKTMSLKDTNYTTLHELIHWTGHKSRLNRDSIVNLTNENIHLLFVEEAIANYGAYTIIQHLGLNSDEFDLEYIKRYHGWQIVGSNKWGYKDLDLTRAKKEAIIAANYLLEKVYEQYMNKVA